MDDEDGKVELSSNSVAIHWEPPPSLGMVAHIWAGHLAAPAEPIEPAADGEGTIAPPSPQALAALD